MIFSIFYFTYLINNYSGVFLTIIEWSARPKFALLLFNQFNVTSIITEFTLDRLNISPTQHRIYLCSDENSFFLSYAGQINSNYN